MNNSEEFFLSKGGLFLVLMFAASISAGCFYGGNVTYKDLEPVLSVVQNISGMVFTIMGVWVACIYPGVMAKIVGGGENIESLFPGVDYKRIERIIIVICSSALIMLCILISTTLKILLKESGVYAAYPLPIKRLGFSAVLLLVLMQGTSLCLVFLSNLDFLINLISHEKRRRLDSKNP